MYGINLQCILNMRRLLIQKVKVNPLGIPCGIMLNLVTN